VTAAALGLDLDLELMEAPGPRIVASAARPAAPAAAPSSRAGRTLDELISGAWEGLSAHQTVMCPVCSGPMAPRYGSGARPVGGRCRRCASTLG
jgi:hypothetical protein